MSIFTKEKTYLDYASGALLAGPAVFSIFRNIRQLYSNPASIHDYGQKAFKIVEKSRAIIAKTIGSHNDEIIFTGSGTESIALAIMGTVSEAKKTITKPHIITSTIEHSAVIETCRMLESRGEIEVTYLKPDDVTGKIESETIKNAIKENTVIITIHLVNSEIGTVQNIDEYLKTINKYKEEKYKIQSMRFTSNSYYPYLHLDACQAYVHMDLKPYVKKGVDLISFNSIKIGGPAGIAALYKRRGATIEKIYAGGSQEMGLRPGTVSPMLINSFASAAEYNLKNLKLNEEKYLEIKKYLLNKIDLLRKETNINFIENSSDSSVPSIINLSFPYFSGQQMAIELNARGVMVSSKSACNTQSNTESYVIDEIRKKQSFDTYKNYGSIRVSFGPRTNKSDINKLVKELNNILRVYRGVLY